MRRLMIATTAAAALALTATAASAQYYADDSYNGGPYVERSVGLRVGPVGVDVYSAPSYEPAPSYSYRENWRGDTSNSTYNSRAFRSQEWYPQSPPGGGY